MKRLLFVTCLVAYLIIFATVCETARADIRPRDVSPNDPAYRAVKTLIDEGYLQLYQDQTFQGNKPVDRLTLAILIARILNEIANGDIGTTKNDIALLHNLTDEFRDELRELHAKDETFAQKVDDLSYQNKVLKEDLTTSTANLQTLVDDQAALRKEAQKMIDSYQGLQDRISLLEEENAALKKKQQTQQTYLWVAIILAIVGIVH